MTIEEYIQKLNEAKRLAVDRFGNLTQTEKAVVDGSFEWLVNNLEIKKGEITVDEDMSAAMDEFVKAVVDTVNSVPGFQSNMKKFLADLNTIQNNNKVFHATTHNFNIETAGVTDTQKAVVDQIIEQFKGAGLNAHFAQPLKESVFRNILAGANMKQIKEVLNNYILSGQDQSGKLSQYLDQTAMQAVDLYTGAINQKLVEDFTFTGYIISGSLIETSSKQCVTAVEESNKTGGYLPYSEWEKILDIARNNPKAKLIPGTTIKNLPVFKLHWGCRHDFTPVIMDEPKPKPKPQEKPSQAPPPPEPKKPKPKPQVQETPYKKPRNKADGKQIAKDILEKNLGLNVESVTVSSAMTLEDFDLRLQEIQRLSNAYDLNPVIDRTKPLKVKFKSGARYYGKVTNYDFGRWIGEVNFGDLTDSAANRTRQPGLQDYSRPKSRVDADKFKLATTTHEFTHLMGIKYQALHNDRMKQFFEELKGIQQEYILDLHAFKKLNTAEGDDKYSNVFLGSYASTNINEFMAEGFTEYQLSSDPSKYAKKIGLLIDKYFKK